MSDIRFNRWLHQSGTGGVSQDSSGNIGIGTTVPTMALDVRGDVNIGNTININNASGIISATTFTGTTGTFSGNISAVDATFTGNVTIGGTLTYEDVANIDAVGIITAQSDIIVGGGLTVTGISTFNNDVKLLDNDKLKFGIGEDLEIYHDGSNSQIKETGAGGLKITSGDIYLKNPSDADMIHAQSGGYVKLYYDGSQKFETTNTGAVVTGILTATTFSGNLTGNVTGDLTGNLAGISSIAAISSSISDTAVDVFVYDTRKDSDGGAWRKRTQHTSWYNETLNTTTRGSRKEFPAVAVIVAESDKVTIYDGDDPDLPMWMVFTFGMIRSGIQNTNVLSAVSMLNGVLFTTVGSDANSNPYNSRIDFLKEECKVWGGARYYILGGIISRNSGYTFYQTTDFEDIVNAYANDVAMTVLPNAPIDDTTGLPVPTIAVATEGGISIIKDDGTVVDMVPNDSGERPATEIGFTESNKIVFKHEFNWVYYYEIPSVDLSAAYWNGLSGYIGRFTSPDRDWDTSFKGIPVHAPSNTDITTFVEDRALGHGNGLNIIDINKDGLLGYGMQVGISTDFNTGWMHGDIKGAFLSDTDTTDSNADTLNSGNAFDGTFASSTGWTTDSDWTISGGVATCNGNDSGRFIYPTTDRWSYNRSVVVEVTVTAYTSGTLAVSYATGAATAGTNMTATGTYKFVNVTSGNDLIYFRSESFIGSIDNVKIYYAEEDRSVNTKGLITYGTVPKSAVATGADLVSYGPFSTSNHLRQPYNSDLNVETNDFSIMFWMHNTGTNSHQTLVSRDDREFDISILDNSNYSRRFRIYAEQSGNTSNSFDSNDDPFPLNTWSHVCVNYTRGNTVSIYVNGTLNKSGTLNYDIDDTSHGLNIGARNTSGSYAHGADGTKLALVRISKSAPSSEQVKKIYEDEKMLFQENAKATLYGSSDAVTALAYDEDTELLHVGTSAGRSDFQGLCRINNTTTAVTTAISASDELIAEQ